MIRKGHAVWKGDGKTGSGQLTTTSSVLKDTPYSFKLRFEDEEGRSGTNPEELLGAAHAGCFAMALSFALAGEDITADELDVTADVKIESVEGGFKITGITLHLSAKIPGISEEEFQEVAKGAKENCPVSAALSAVPISLEATLA